MGVPTFKESIRRVQTPIFKIVSSLRGTHVNLDFIKIFLRFFLKIDSTEFLSRTVKGMEILLFNSNYEVRSSFETNHSETITLLIPQDTWFRFLENDRKILSKKIPEFLKTYGKYFSSQKHISKKAEKILYQPSQKNQKMKRVNVRVKSKNWILFEILAQAHGVSRCYLFNYLLWLETLGVRDSIVNTVNARAPTFHRSYRYILDVDLLSHQVTRKLRFKPKNHFHILKKE
ncbi:PF07600 family protein [Leptospira interrogans str. L1207]|nr:PF07600 family protein [Leptospira interrogans str. L1207]